MSQFGWVLAFSAMNNLFPNIVHPVTPTLLTQMGYADYMFGVLFAMMALGMLIMSPLWGRFADRHGRRPTFCLGMTLYTLAQIGFFLGRSEAFVLVMRFLGGIGSSGGLVALTACAIDLTDEDNRAARMSAFAAVNCIAASGGYFLGGMLGVLSVSHAFFAQFITLGLMTLSALWLLPETRQAHTPAASSTNFSSLSGFRQALRGMTPVLAVFLLCVTFATLSTYGYDNAFNYFIKRELGLNSSYNGIIKAVTGILGFVATLGVNRVLINRFAVDKVLPPVFLLCALSLLVSTFMSTLVGFFALSILFYLFNAMYQPLQQSLMTRASDGDFGLLSGLFNSARALGMIVGSLAAGFLYTVSPRAPFYMQVACFVLAACLSFIFSRLLARPTARKAATPA
ncbi:MAG: MFS transporter [Clostridia bacterium]